jgi:hypothetical protein
MKTLLPAIGLALAVGCTTAHVRPYIGKQQSWPTAVGSIVNTRYALPVFTSLPPSPYYVLAELRIDSPLYARPEEQHLPCLVKKAAAIGADAVVLVEGQLFFSVSYGQKNTNDTINASRTATLTAANRFNPDFFKAGVTAVAIKWKGDAPPGLFRNAVSDVAIGELEVAPAATPAAPAPEPPQPAVVKPEAPKPPPPVSVPAAEQPKTETPPPTPPVEQPKTETPPPTPPVEQPKTETLPPTPPVEQPKTEQPK